MYEMENNGILHDAVSEVVMQMNFDKILVHMRRTVLRKFKSLISQDENVP